MVATQNDAGERLVAVAAITRPHGIRGELRVVPYNSESVLLAPRLRGWIRRADGERSQTRLLSVRPTSKGLLVQLEGVAGRDEAERLRGAVIEVRRKDFPPLEDGEFYACDIEGARAVLASGEAVGVVRELRSYPSVDVLVVERSDDAEPPIEVPLVEAYVERVDPEAFEVVLTTIEGL